MDRVTQDLLNKFDIGSDRAKVMERGAKAILPYLDAALDHFYDIAQADSEMAAFFPNEAVLIHARNAQKRHWQMLLAGDFEQEYLESAMRVGRVHFKIQLPFSLYLSGYSRATSFLQNRFLENASGMIGRAGRVRKAEQLSALTRIFAFDTYLVFDAYFEAQKAEQDLAFSYLSDGMQRMSSRDLSEPIPDPENSDFPVRFDGIRKDFNGLMSSLKSVITTIQDATGNLDRIAVAVNQSAEELAHRTESQAATLQHTTESVDGISDSIRAARDAADQTAGVVSGTLKNGRNGTKVVAQAVEKMREISESSTEITQIINVIDDIAFQTNLLALNAGVEAARAGEAGRGFAVVASEVRALAQRAANSAKEIKSLVTDSNDHVSTGVSLVDQAGDALTRIVNEIDEVSNLTNDVSDAARVQSDGLSEITLGVRQMETVTQQNAGMVEETASAILSMKQDMKTLADLIRTFNVGSVPAQSQPALRIAGE